MDAPIDAAWFLPRLLTAIEAHILPLTRKGVAAGNKIFGAALLSKADGSVILAETNNETENPLWHGEIHALKRFYELPRRPPVADLVFLSTHEPCPMCLSAITWAGFDNFCYFFGHADSRDRFAIPHDLRILSEVFGLPADGYRKSNAYWQAHAIAEMIAAADPSHRAELAARAADIAEAYAALSAAYQARKAETTIPLP